MKAEQVLPEGVPLYSVPEVCEILHLTKSSVYRHVRAGRLRLTKIGGRTVVRRADLESLILGDQP